MHRFDHAIDNHLLSVTPHRSLVHQMNVLVLIRPVESHSGARGNIIAGPYHRLPHSVCLEIETPKASRGRKRGERCPLTIRLGVRGSVVSSPSGVRPRPKMHGFMHIFGQKEATWNTIFSIFERRRGPTNVAGPGKTPPSRRAWP